MNDFIAIDWQPLLKNNKLLAFSDFWQLDIGWFEEPNQRRGGWSGVSTITLQDSASENQTFFIKRQQNHTYKTWRSPFKGAPTFQREFNNINRFTIRNIPTLEPIYFAIRKDQQDQKAILITKALTGYYSLESLTRHWQQSGWPTFTLRKKIIKSIATVIARMHQHGFRHGCLYPKHIFIKLADTDNIDVRIIDLEKARFWPFKYSRMARDLSVLQRHTKAWSAKEHLLFLKYYFNVTHLDAQSKRFMKYLQLRNQRKSRI